jgi:glycosyltransferase involved in cell wall biosynthesis
MKFLHLLVASLILFSGKLVLAEAINCKDFDLSHFIAVENEQIKEQTIATAIERAHKAKLDLEEIREFYPKIDEVYKEVLAMVDVNSAQPLLSIVIPAYKEAQRLPESLVKIQQFFDRFPIPVEVNVMVEKSPDLTYEIDSELVKGDSRITVVDNIVKQGKGYAVRSGMLRSKGKYVLFMDADLSTPLPEILNFLKLYKDNPNYQVVIGDRKSNADAEEQNRSLLRRSLSYGFNQLVRQVSGSDIKDTQCGFKAFTANASQQIFKYQSLNGFAFDVEVLAIAQELGIGIEAVPVRWIDDERTTVHPIIDPMKMAYDLLRIRRNVRKNLQQVRQVDANQP